MSGVIDENGQQWERCNGCSRFVRIEELRYCRLPEGHPSIRTLHDLGYHRDTKLDLCAECAPDEPAVGPAAIIHLR